eukprot:TRINITY_DN201762_c0_g1_i1.p1 TRINITY_DN201762_c0_g1~~TRINITY_DN201762_c0_g1_i1.p1  ORF type:complete len:161 (-),score=23.38 TRINITY_DN201762_c0_g1_i1:143-625(-)
MKSKIFMSLVVASLLGTGLYAKGNMADNNGAQNPKKCEMMKKHHKSHKDGFLGLLKKINLTDKQDAEVKKIVSSVMEENKITQSAFSKDGFDKKKFIEIRKQKRENMLESQAEIIDRIYNKVLTDKQKEQLKVLMDLKKEKRDAMMSKRMNFDKDCHGRR